MPDSGKALGRDVLNKSFDKDFFRMNSLLHSLSIFPVSKGRSYLLFTHLLDSGIGNCNPMGVPSQIFDHIFGLRKSLLGKYHPRLIEQIFGYCFTNFAFCLNMRRILTKMARKHPRIENIKKDIAFCF